jgi:3',5'-cyclic AMP phosphodiesterase CpdA
MRNHARTGSGRPFVALGVLLILALLLMSVAPRSGAQDPAHLSVDMSPAAPEPATAEAAVDLGQAAPEAMAPAVLLAAGDIAACDSTGDEATATLLDSLPGTIATLGDNVYNSGTATEFAQCYEPSWGRHKGRTRPAPGNHDYKTPGASAYFAYFGGAAGEQGKGYYSYDLGAWHIIALNSNCAEVGGCNAGSPQERWLRADLAAHPTTCTLAYWHHPLFSSGPHGAYKAVQPMWQALYDAGADVVLVGHDHLYERFVPQNPQGQADPTRGIRQFTVGTGGKSHYRLLRVSAQRETANENTFGVLKLTLRRAAYDWEFVPVAGQSHTDFGAASCHT